MKYAQSKRKFRAECFILFHPIYAPMQRSDSVKWNEEKKKKKVKTLGCVDVGKEELYACIQRDTRKTSRGGGDEYINVDTNSDRNY